jgi:sugar phosphate isomerase/epimerase
VTQKIGLNMYSLRELGKSASELTSTFRRVHEMGYRYVQISGLGSVTPDEIANALAETGLKVCATHLGWDRLTQETDEVIALHSQYGTTHAAVGSLPDEYHSRQGADRFIAEAEKVIPRLVGAGLDFSYHNHSDEFVRFDGETWIDIIHEAGVRLGLKFEVDTYWVVAGGGDPALYIERFAEAMSIVHVKDMVIVPVREQRYAPVGDGNLNWPAIFAAIRKSPVEYVIVEQDEHYDDDPFENVARSYRFLVENGFAQE